MRRTAVIVVLGLLAISGWGQSGHTSGGTQESIEGFVFVVGPRVGVTYTFMTPAEFTEHVQRLYPSGDYYPVTTVFGITIEQRILLGQTQSHFAFQEVILISGLEQSIALPSGALFIGYRDRSGFEIGIGPILSISGIGVAGAIGWTLSFRGVYVPINVNYVLPSSQRPASIGMTTGFNFRVHRR